MDESVTCRDWATAYRKHYESENVLTSQNEENIYEQIIHSLQGQLTDDYMIKNDAGNFASWLHKYFPFTKPHTYVETTSDAMEYGLQATSRAKLDNRNNIVGKNDSESGCM